MSEVQTIETIDDSTASSKITITITGAFFNDDRSQAYVKTNWFCEGKQLTIRDLIHVIESGKEDMIRENTKGLEEQENSPVT